jgi:hypothetical protein
VAFLRPGRRGRREEVEVMMHVSAVDPWLHTPLSAEGAPKPYAFLGTDLLSAARRGVRGLEELSWLLEMEEAEGDPIRVLIAGGRE